MRTVAIILTAAAAGAIFGHENAIPWLFTRQAVYVALAGAVVAPLVAYGRVSVLRGIGIACMRLAEHEECRQRVRQQNDRSAIRAMAEIGLGD